MEKVKWFSSGFNSSHTFKVQYNKCITHSQINSYWRFQQPTSFTHRTVPLASFTQREKQLLLDAKETDFATQKSQHFSQSHISVSQNLQMKSLSRISFKISVALKLASGLPTYMNFSTFCAHEGRCLPCVALSYDITSVACDQCMTWVETT